MHPSLVTPNGPSPLQQAGVDERDLTIGEIRLREVTNLSLARLRSGHAAPPGGTGVAQLPTRTGQCSGSDPAFLCLGPQEWLVLSTASGPSQLVQSLQSAIGAGLAAAYDLTPGLVVLRLSGEAAPWLLSKLSCLDFISGTAAGRHCARTRMADAAVTIHYHQPADEAWAFDLIADRSMAAYLWGLLGECAPHANELSNAFGASR